jgi:DNA invertase Pin-like site-specific DNA recombinase
MFQAGDDPGLRVLLGGTPIRAAAYVRKSKESQKYSIESQLHAINDYAVLHGMTVVKIYADPGRTGLVLKGRIGLQGLLADIEEERAQFSVVLVYDVSRWGRFQNMDESAYYEHHCTKGGVRVIYCAEPFEGDHSPASYILKTIRRMMSAEYSRDLSTKVFVGQCASLSRGFWPTGIPAIGLRRCLVGPDGAPKIIMNRGERKFLTEDRTILVPGPAHEVEQVQRVFELFIGGSMSINGIARSLNAARTSIDDTFWTHGRIHGVLRNESYVGTLVFNRSSWKLKSARVKNSPETWLRRDGVVPPIISREVFDRAQEEIKRRATRYTDEFLLEKLRELLNRKGDLSASLILKDPFTPCIATFKERFGSLQEAYERVGYCRLQDSERYRGLKRVALGKDRLRADFQARLDALNIPYTPGATPNTLLVNWEMTIAFNVAYCTIKQFKKPAWHWRHVHRIDGDITLLARMAPGNQEFLDYYSIPLDDLASFPTLLRRDNHFSVDAYRASDLSRVVSISQRVSLKEFAQWHRTKQLLSR